MFFNNALNAIGKIFNNENNNSSSQSFVINNKTFSVNKLLGEGGYGYVYEVSDQNMNKYALKKMNILNDKQFQSIKREISIWKELQSNNIVSLLDFQKNQDCILILMELCTEGSLLDYINNYKGNIPENEALKIIYNISLGLQSMHSKNICHRDIKIENILKFGNTWKICDFGSASREVYNPQINKENKKYFFEIFEKNTTFMYRPPEMIDEYCNYIVDTKVDIWSLGCILYTILFKCHPFQDAQKLTIIKADYYIPKESSNYSIKILDLIMYMLTPNPSLRPNINQILNILTNYKNMNIESLLSNDVKLLKQKKMKIYNEKYNKTNKDEISIDDLEKAKLSIMKKLEKNKKYKKYEDNNLDGIFDQEDEMYHEGKNYKKNEIPKKNNDNNGFDFGMFNKQENKKQNNNGFNFDIFNNKSNQNNQNNFNNYQSNQSNQNNFNNYQNNQSNQNNFNNYQNNQNTQGFNFAQFNNLQVNNFQQKNNINQRNNNNLLNNANQNILDFFS